MPVPPLRVGLFVTAFLTGAVVMALEMLGSRVLAPVFGNSLFVWGALIGVILAAMSTGYAAGGWLADRHDGKTVLAGLLLLSGAWTFLLAWKGHPVMFAVADRIQDPRWGPCAAAALLLAPPAFGLSGVLPVLLRLTIGDMGHLGRHTGGLIAVSTVGSLAGTWGTAFFLLTWLGSMALIAWLGAVQILLGMLWWWRAGAGRTAHRVRAIGATILLAAASALGWLAIHPDLVLPAPVYQEDSPYQQVRVRDTDLLRYLILDRTFHAVMWRVEPNELFLPYSQLMVAAVAVAPNPRRGLILGHGGGSLAKWLGKYWPDLELDLVEVDPSVAHAAQDYFSYAPSPNHRVIVQDARAFLRTTPESYDIIWVDVFARHLIPFHLTTREFFELLRAHLDQDGVLAVNLASAGDASDRHRTAAVVTTLRTVFPLVESYAVKSPFKSRTPDAANLLFFAGTPVSHMDAPSFLDHVTGLIMDRKLPVEALSLLQGKVSKPWPPGRTLTDDFAPFDLLIGREEAGAPAPLPGPQP
jgi:spermidine synthase